MNDDLFSIEAEKSPEPQAGASQPADPVEPEATTAAAGEILPPASPPVDYEVITRHAAMLKEIRSWGIWLLVLGAIHIFTAGFLNAGWGILLIVVGLASFFFRSASMFVVYGITLAWAALSNMLSGQTSWLVFSAVQVFMTVSVFLQFRRFRKVESAALQISDRQDLHKPAERAARAFPWIGSLFGCSSILGFVLYFLTIFIINAVTGNAGNTPGYLDIIFSLVIYLGVLGFAVCLAALLSKYRLKGLAIAGLVGSLLTLAAVLVLVLIA